MITQTTYQQAVAARDAAAHALYEAELAVHDANQTGVDAWISAAYRHLHEAIAQHSAAIENVAVFDLAA